MPAVLPKGRLLNPFLAIFVLGLFEPLAIHLHVTAVMELAPPVLVDGDDGQQWRRLSFKALTGPAWRPLIMLPGSLFLDM